MTKPLITESLKIVAIWDDVPVAAFAEYRDAILWFDQRTTDASSDFGADSDLVRDAGGVEFELRQYKKDGEYDVLKSHLIRPHDGGDGDDDGRNPVCPSPSPSPETVS